MAKLFSLFLIALFGFSQVTTQTVPDLEILLDLNGDETVNVADVVLLAGFVLSGQVWIGGRGCPHESAWMWDDIFSLAG